MRKIQASQILTFVFLFTLGATLSWLTCRLTLDPLPLAEYRPIAMVGSWVFWMYVWSIGLFRLFTRIWPLPEGWIPEGSQAEFVYHVYLLFFLILFYPIIRSGFMPVPAMRLFYQALGAKMGENSYSSGLLLDPQFISMGSNCIIGQYSALVPHAIEGKKLGHWPIRLGNNVTIGGAAIVLGGTTIGDGAIVSSGAVVPKGTVIGPGEIWGGVPAKRIDRQRPAEPSKHSADGAKVRAKALSER